VKGGYYRLKMKKSFVLVCRSGTLFVKDLKNPAEGTIWFFCRDFKLARSDTLEKCARL